MAKVIDADSHMFEQPGLWRERIPKADQHLALDIEEDELGYSWLTHQGNPLLQCYISEPGEMWNSYGLPHQRQREGKPALRRYTEMPLTYYQPTARRDALDGWGLDEQVIFPNWGLNFGWYLQGDLASELVNISAWNRWAAEVRVDGGGRLRPVGHLSLRADLAWIEEQLEAMARAGITQVFLPLGLVDGRRMSHPDFDAVWSRMQALELSPTFHIGAFAERIIDDGWQANDVIQYMTTQSLVMNGLDAQLAVSDLNSERGIRPTSRPDVAGGRVFGRMAAGDGLPAGHRVRHSLRGHGQAQHGPAAAPIRIPRAQLPLRFIPVRKPETCHGRCRRHPHVRQRLSPCRRPA